MEVLVLITVLLGILLALILVESYRLNAKIAKVLEIIKLPVEAEEELESTASLHQVGTPQFGPRSREEVLAAMQNSTSPWAEDELTGEEIERY